RIASEKGHHDAHANDAAQAAAETLAAAEARAKQATQKRAAEAAEGERTTARSKSQRGIGPREKVFGPGRLVPLDRNAKVRVMMVRALMRHQEKGKGLRQ